MKLNWNLPVGGGGGWVEKQKPSIGEVWTISVTAH